MTGKMAVLTLVALAFLPGCSSLLFKTSEAPQLYQAPYAPRVVACPSQFGQGVRVWEFSAAAPYNGAEMVVRAGNQQVVLSRADRWVASPGAMVTEHLYRDLTQGSLFAEVATGATPRALPLALTGRIFNFDWVKDGVTPHAELNIEATLGGGSQVDGIIYFHKVYTLSGDRVLQNVPGAFAEGMGRLLAEFSQRLQSDLCEVARDQGSHPGNGDRH